MSEAVDAPTTIWADRFIKRELLPAGELAKRFNILNPRSHPEAQRDATESSLDTVGWIDEISLSTNGDGPASLADNPDAVMFDGHDRVELVLVRGGEGALLPVKWYQLTPKETDFALLVKDPTTEMAETKPKELAALLERTRTMTIDPRLGAMLERLKLKAGINGNGQSDNGNEPPMPTETEAERLAKQWATAPGQIWQLGRHIIACLDSTDEASVRELIGGKAVGMVWADPPYGMGLDTNFDDMFTNDPEHRVTGYRFAKVIGDDKPFDPNFFMSAFGKVNNQVWWGADYYADKIPNLVDGTFLIWDKRCSDEMDKVVGNVYEMAWLKGKRRKQIARILWSGHHGMQGDDTRTRVHPTQKPVALPVWCFSEYGHPEDLIFDPFLGSGISVLAAEKLNDGRRVIGCELAPEYIAVTIHRFVQMTGQQPKLLTGQTPRRAAS